MSSIDENRIVDFRSFHSDFLKSSISELSEKSLFVFDFDGVIISRKEELVYRLPTFDGEREILIGIAARVGIRPESYDTPYLRHIIYQYALERLSIECQRGPLFDLAEQIKTIGCEFYVITARSALPAIRRALSFVEREGIEPTEMFFVGRVGKGRQLNLLKSAFQKKQIFYFDDSVRHFRNARKMISDIESIYVDLDDYDLDSVIFDYRSVVMKAFEINIS